MRPRESPNVSAIGPNDAPWLHPAVIDAIARRMFELEHEPDTDTGPGSPDLLTVAEVAERLKMTPKWVYVHQHRLGVIKLGDGPRARLRFDPRIVEAQLKPEERPSTDATNRVPVPMRTEARKKGRRRLRSRPVPPTAPRHA